MNDRVFLLLLTLLIFFGIILTMLLVIVHSVVSKLLNNLLMMSNQNLTMSKDLLNRLMSGDVKTFQIMHQATASSNDTEQYIATDDVSEAQRHSEMTGEAYGTVDVDDEANNELWATLSELNGHGAKFHSRED